MRSTLRMRTAQGDTIPQVWAEPFIHIYNFLFAFLMITNMTRAWPEDHPKTTQRWGAILNLGV